MDELAELEQRINHKIAQTKDKMHKTQERTEAKKRFDNELEKIKQKGDFI